MDKNNTDQCTDFWETMFLQADELDGLHGNYLGEEFPESYDLGSPVEKQSSINTKYNIVSERNRRKKLTEKLYTLRSVVPNITKMDKESIVRDAIEYIKKLHEEQKKIQAEISDMESAGRSSKSKILEFDQEEIFKSKTKRIRTDQEHFHYSKGSRSFPTEVIQLRASSMGEKTIIISLRCSKRTDTIVKLNEQFASLNLKIINANITAFSDSILMTVVIQADKKEKDLLKIKIERAIAELNDPQKNYFLF